jgi:hypothetical protein
MMLGYLAPTWRHENYMNRDISILKVLRTGSRGDYGYSAEHSNARRT